MGHSDTLSGRRSFTSIFIILITTIGLTLYSCSDSTTTGANEHEQPGTEDPITDDIHPVCEDLKILTDTGKPMDIIDIEGFQDDFGDEPFGWIYSDEDDERLVPIYINADYPNETAEFILPLHPIHWMDGGETEVTISNHDSTLICSGLQMTIEPLEPAPGETERFLDEFDAFITELINQLGYNLSELVDENVSSLPEEVAPLVVALRAFDDDYVENNIRAVLSGDAPILEGETLPEDALMAVDALFGKTGLANAFSTGFAAKESSLNRASCSGYDKSNMPPACLDLQVKLQNQFQTSIEGVSGAFYQFSEDALSAASIGLAVVALGTAGAAAPAAVAAGVAGNAMAIHNLFNDSMANVLPSQFTNFDLIAGPVTFNEDSEEIGEWVGFVEFASRGTTITYAKIATLLPHGKLLDNQIANEMIREVSNKVAQITLSMGLTIIESQSEQGITLESTLFRSYITPDRDDDEIYFNWELNHRDSWDGSQAFEYYIDLNTGFIDELRYIPVVEGKTELRTRINDGAFNLSPGPVQTEELILNPIEITVTPDETVLYLSDFENDDLKVEIAAEVENADDEKLEWDAEDGGEGFFIQNDNEGHEMTYFPPEEPGTYLLVAESTTETGPRQGRTPPRSETVRVRVMGESDAQGLFFLQPDPGCVALDEEFTFNAYLGDPFDENTDPVPIPFTDIFWDMRGPGNLSDDGTFTPDEKGVVDIAFLYEDPNTGNTHSNSTSFVVLEGCGELTVESDYFKYSTDCVSARLIRQSFFSSDVSVISAAGWRGGGTNMNISMDYDIESKTGSWTKSFVRTLTGLEGWDVAFFIDEDGEEWQPITAAEIENLSSETLEIERTEITLGDRNIGLLSGEFRITMFNLTESEQKNLYSDERTISTFNGEFSFIPIVSGLNICN